MTPTRMQARILAALLLLHLAGLIAPFALLLPMVPAEYLATAAASAGQVKLAIVLLVVTCTLTVWISLHLRALLRPAGEIETLLLVVAGGAIFTLQGVDNAHLLSMLSLSERPVGTGTEAELLRGMGDALQSTRRWVHYVTLLSIEIWMFTFYLALHRARLVPRALTLFGLATVLLHFSGVVAPFFLEGPAILAFAVSMGVSELALALWLAARGFAVHHSPAVPG